MRRIDRKKFYRASWKASTWVRYGPKVNSRKLTWNARIIFKRSSLSFPRPGVQPTDLSQLINTRVVMLPWLIALVPIEEWTIMSMVIAFCKISCFQEEDTHFRTKKISGSQLSWNLSVWKSSVQICRLRMNVRIVHSLTHREIFSLWLERCISKLTSNHKVTFIKRKLIGRA